MEAWDAEDFEPTPVIAPAVANLNKWEGEDEDEDVKESWEDEEEEANKQAGQEEAKSVESKPKKKQSLAEKIAEKERKKREDMEKRMKEAQEEEEEEISPEEKLRRQKESDLKLALETTFGGDVDAGNNIKAGQGGLLEFELPNTKEEFEQFTDALWKKLQPLSKNIEYPVFAENLLRNLCATMSSLDIKKLKNTVDNLYMEKQKIEKGDKAKKNKGKGKAKLKIDDQNPLSYVNDYDDFDDFM